MDVAIEIDDMEVGRLPNDFAEKLTASLLPRYPKPWIDWQEDG